MQWQRPMPMACVAQSRPSRRRPHFPLFISPPPPPPPGAAHRSSRARHFPRKLNLRFSWTSLKAARERYLQEGCSEHGVVPVQGLQPAPVAKAHEPPPQPSSAGLRQGQVKSPPAVRSFQRVSIQVGCNID